jgi:hypothetical protein
MEGDMKVAKVIPKEELLKYVKSISSDLQDMYKQKVQPWSSFFERSRFSKPENFSLLKSRVIQNLLYYQYNYVVIFGLLLIYSLVTNLLLLLGLVVLGGLALYTYYCINENGVALMGRTCTRTQLFQLIGILTIPFLWFSSASYTIFWLVCVSGTLIMLHAAFAGPCLEMEFSSQV